MKKRNYLAIRIRKQLEAAAEKAGKGVPLIVNRAFYFQMRSNILKDLEQETRVEYLRAGLFCLWNGRMIFLKNEGDPAPYPEGTGIIKDMENRRKGR